MSLDRYIEQLLLDFEDATNNIRWPFIKKESYDLSDWVSPEEEEMNAPVYQLEEWTGIKKEMLPPHELLSDEQIDRLFCALNKMLNAYNWMWITQIEVPVRIQYAAIRDNFNQPAKAKHFNVGFFAHCRPDTPHGQCALGKYCHCGFFAEMFKGMVKEDLTPEEERARELQWEIERIKKKYNDDWMKYYPYHLDPKYDENKNPYSNDIDDEND